MRLSQLLLPPFSANPNPKSKQMAVAALTSAPSLYPSDAYIGNKPAKQTRALVSKLCRQFYTHGWVSGTGGSITIKVRDDSVPRHQQFIVMFPSGVQKEIMVPEDMYVLTGSGSIVSAPSPKSYPHKPPKCTDCAPLFMKAECYHYLFEEALKMHQLGLDCSSPSHLPIQSIKGVLAGGRKSRGLLKAQVVSEDREGKQPSRLCILLDIEGTTTPISFVSDVLFPYARDNVENHLAATYDTRETQEDIKLLRAQVEEDLKQGVVGSRPIPPDEAGKDEVIASIVANVQTMIKADRKITALKQLQGHIWRTGFENNELQGVFFEDVPEALHKWHSMGIKVYIYSSGSREAQRQIFGNTAYGDLRKYLCGFFDTTIGNKRETHSYFEISQSLGVDKPSQILFLTDVYQEAVAANAAGLEVMISVRPGNGALPDNHEFKTIKSFLEI